MILQDILDQEITRNCLPATQAMLAIPKMLHLLCTSQQQAIQQIQGCKIKQTQIISSARIEQFNVHTKKLETRGHLNLQHRPMSQIFSLCYATTRDKTKHMKIQKQVKIIVVNLSDSNELLLCLARVCQNSSRCFELLTMALTSLMYSGVYSIETRFVSKNPRHSLNNGVKEFKRTYVSQSTIYTGLRRF